jgi:hypothetical protein
MIVFGGQHRDKSPLRIGTSAVCSIGRIFAEALHLDKFETFQGDARRFSRLPRAIQGRGNAIAIMR